MKFSGLTKSILFVLGLFVCMFLAIGGLILQDYAKVPFWWNFWTYSPIAGVVGFLGLLIWYNSSKQQN